MPDPTPYLTRSGKAFYNKLTERQKLRPLDYLRPHHFTDYDVFNDFCKECQLAPFKEKIGSLTDPAALDRLCEILAGMQDKINELESTSLMIIRHHPILPPPMNNALILYLLRVRKAAERKTKDCQRFLTKLHNKVKNR